MTVRRAEDRFHTDLGWLDSHHTFSFGGHYDPRHMGFRALRVINDDTVVPGAGFGTHPHRDMEIVSYVLSGALAHKDSMGNGSTILPGEVQRMTAGTGVTHSEHNPSQEEGVHFLQIWILPATQGLPPGYEQRRFDPEEQRGRLRLIASDDGRDASVTVHQEVDVYAGRFRAGEGDELQLTRGGDAYVFVARGSIEVGGETLSARDGASFTGEASLKIQGVDAGGDAEVLVFDLA